MSSSAVVLDSSFIIGFHNTRDAHHSKAGEIMARLLAGEWERAFLLEYVFLEVVTVLRMRLDLPTAVSVGETLLKAREIEFLPCSELFYPALDTFRDGGDAPLSFTDAAIVTVARRNSPGFVATFDGDFHHLSGVVVVA